MGISRSSDDHIGGHHGHGHRAGERLRDQKAAADQRTASGGVTLNAASPDDDKATEQKARLSGKDRLERRPNQPAKVVQEGTAADRGRPRRIAEASGTEGQKSQKMKREPFRKKGGV